MPPPNPEPSPSPSAPGAPLSPGLCAELACILEVSARKPGNVTLEASFVDAGPVDFLLAAAAAGRALDRAAEKGVGRSVLEAVEASRALSTGNANLGLILLLAPLAAALGENPSGVTRSRAARVLGRLTSDDAELVYRAIRRASPGGLGEAPEEDVYQGPPGRTLVEAMALAAECDLVARQYSGGFKEVFELGLPALRESLAAGRPLETAIVLCHLRFLAAHPDSLIWRKCGEGTAREASTRAREALKLGWPDGTEAAKSLAELDQWLRADGHRRNPGTSADLVGASLFLALANGIISLPLSYEKWRHRGDST